MERVSKSRTRQLFTPASLLIFYGATAYASAIYASASKVPLPFQYHLEFSVDELLVRSYIPLLQFGAILLGSYCAILQGRKFVSIRLKFRWYSAKLFLAAAIFLLVYFLTLTALSYGVRNHTGEIGRTISDKGTQLILIGVTLLAIVNLDRRRYGWTTIAIVIATAAVLASVDGTRTAVLPAFLLLIYGIARKNHRVAVIGLLCFMVLLTLIESGRFLAREYERDYWLIFGLLTTESIPSMLGYFLGFSYIHLFVAYETDLSNFGMIDFIYSITPVPSGLLPYHPDPTEWRLDIYRPIGAQAHMLALSPAIFFLSSFSIGFVAGRARYLANATNLSVVTILLLLCFAGSFQYNLRTVQWFFWLAVVILALSKRADQVTLHRIER